MESRQEAQRSLHLLVVSVVFPLQGPSFAAISLKNPNTLRSGAASLIQTQRGATHSQLEIARKPAGTFHHLSFHFELEMGLCSVFQAAGVENTFSGSRQESLWWLLALAGDIAQVFRAPDPSGKKALLTRNCFDPTAHGFLKQRVAADGESQGLKNNASTYQLLCFCEC